MLVPDSEIVPASLSPYLPLYYRPSAVPGSYAGAPTIKLRPQKRTARLSRVSAHNVHADLRQSTCDTVPDLDNNVLDYIQLRKSTVS